MMERSADLSIFNTQELSELIYAGKIASKKFLQANSYIIYKAVCRNCQIAY